MKAQIEVNRIQNIIRSPVDHLYNESINGLTMIRVFNMQEKIMAEFYEKINLNRSCRLITFG